LIVNGDFEGASKGLSTLGVNCPDWCALDMSRGAVIAPWVATAVGYSPVLFEVDRTPWQSSSGSWSMDLCANLPYAINQKVSLVPGQEYALSFMLGQNACGTPVKTGYVTVGDKTYNFYYSQAEFGNSWRNMTYVFVADETAKYVTIGSNTAGSCGPVVDNVQLRSTSCPLPVVASAPLEKKKCSASNML